MINFPLFIINEQASATTRQSSIESERSRELISITELNSRAGKSFSSPSISIRLKLKFLLILSKICILSKFSFFSRIKELEGPLLFKILLRLSRLIPKTSSPVSNCEKELFGRTNLTMEIFAGSIAVILKPESFTFILTSVTSSEIISIILDKNPGFSSFINILNFKGIFI